jgi:sugar phosphate isomerase/epimerase
MRIGCQIGIWDESGEPKTAEEAVVAAGEVNAAGIEVFDSNLATHYGDPAGFREKLQEAAVVLSGIYWGPSNMIDPQAEAEVLRSALTACDFLRSVGGCFLVMNGGISVGELRTFRPEVPADTLVEDAFSQTDYEQLAKVANSAAAAARDTGIDAVIHPHWTCMVETCAQLERLLEAGLDRELVGLCVHAEHQKLAGADPYEMYDKYASWVRYAHIGDHGPDEKGSLIGGGVMDQKRLMGALLDAGYDGWIIIEGATAGVSAAEFIDRAREYMTGQWPQVEWS